MRKFIFGTDWWTDCDDTVALRLICKYAKEAKIELLGVGVNAVMEYSYASVRGFMNAEGIENVPIGIDREATDYGGFNPYQKRLADTFCKGGTNDDAEDAVRLYRRLLANSDGGIEIIEVGFPQVLSALLESGADDISDMDGVALVREKVKKFWFMAGKWDGDGEREHNFCKTERSRKASKKFCALCPVPVIFLGWEVGYGVITGGKLDHSDHLYMALADHGSQNGRHSWDPMLTLMALIGDEEAAGYKTVRGFASVDEEDGANHFVKDETGPHAFVIKDRDNSYYENMINNLIAK